MSAIHLKADVKLVLAQRSANDPKRTFASLATRFKMRHVYKASDRDEFHSLVDGVTADEKNTQAREFQ